jgi:hypothetical protein
MRVKGQCNNLATIGNLFGSIEERLVSLMYAIENSDDYYG